MKYLSFQLEARRKNVNSILVDITTVVNGVGDSDYTPLAHVARNWIETDNEVLQICEVLLNAGADPNLGTPVVKAASQRRQQLVEMLLKYGANINGVDQNYGTVLLMGGWKENHNIVKIALVYNTKISLGQDKAKDFPKLLDTANQNKQLCSFLLQGNCSLLRSTLV